MERQSVSGGGGGSSDGPMPEVTSCLLATGGYDHQIRLWRVDNGSSYRTFQHSDSQVNALTISPDKTIIAAAGAQAVRFYEVPGDQVAPVTVYSGHKANVTSLGFSSSGTWMYTGSEDETVKIWDVRARPDSQRNFNVQKPINTVALHPNEMDLFSGDQSGRIVRWDLRANACREHLIPAPDVPIRSIAVSPDGLLLAAVTNEGFCYVWNTINGETSARQMIEAHPKAYALKCTFSPDGRWLVTTSSDTTARVFDVQNDFELAAVLRKHSMWVWDCAFSGDSAYLVTVSSDKKGCLWDLTQDTEEPALELKAHQRAITAVALHDI